jgi:hypothetical protein
MLPCNCQGSLCIGLKAEQRTLAIVWGRQQTLAAGRRFKLIGRHGFLNSLNFGRKSLSGARSGLFFSAVRLRLIVVFFVFRFLTM